jgi:lantibiotic biosynthesis protein
MMEPWMDDAAGRGADALMTRFVCRVSGAPADTVDGMRAKQAMALLRELTDTEARLHAAREDVSQRLFTAIGAAQEKPLRNKLITLKRELYNLKPQSAERLDAALAGADAETAESVRAFAADVDRVRALEGEVRRAHDEAAAAARGQFREQITDADFRKGLMVSSRSLYGHLTRYAAAAQSGELSGRDEKTERGLLRYYTRMAMKATPFATFCAIIPGAFVDGNGGGVEGETRFSGDPRAKRSFVRINKFLYGLLFDHLKARPAFRHALAVERNPTLRAEGPRLVFLTSIDGREVFQRLGDNEVLQLIATRFADGGSPTLGELIRTLSSDPEIDATPEEAEAYLDKLIEIGFLRFHTGIREQDADWDLPFRALLEGIDDEHAQRSSALLARLRERVEAYTDAGVQARADIIEQIHADIEEALDAMEVKARLRKDMPFYEDATSAASAEISLTPGVRRAFGTFEEWVRATSRLAWPRPDQATMRHFFQDYYGSAEGVPLLKFYEDFYREHFKAHVEKEAKQRAGAGKELEGYDVGNPFGLQSIKDLSAARIRLTEVFRRRWDADRTAESIDISAEEVNEALSGVETLSGVPRSMGAFGLMIPAEREGADPTFLLHGSSYTAGYGKYFSRFLYMLPDDVQEDVRRANAALTGEMLAEICGDAQFNANLHPPLMKWEISYPTGESGNTDEQLRSSEILVLPDPEDPQNLALVHGPTGRRVIPVDLGFLNPRMRPPLYQLLSRFTPPVMYAPSLPESADEPRRPAEQPKLDVDGVTVQEFDPVQAAVLGQDDAPSRNLSCTCEEVAQRDTPSEYASCQCFAQAAPDVAEAKPAADAGEAKPADAQGAEGQPAAEAAPAAEAPAPPPPVINYRPRITFGGGRLVLTRRRWVVPSPLFPQRRADESAGDFFIRANRWRAENGIPETAYLRVMPTPEPRAPQPGQAPGDAADTPAEAAAEIPGYEGGAPEAEVHDEEPEAAEAAAPEAADGAAPEDTPEEAAKKAAEAAKRRTQPSKDFYKPQFMDFGNPLLVGLLGRIGTGLKHYQAVFEERYPDRAALPAHDGEKFVTELVVQLYFPGGTASTATEAGALAEAAPTA